MSASNDGRVSDTKLQYAAPALKVFGSVRDLTGNTSGFVNPDGGGMTMNGTSEPSFKENIVRVGEHPAGFGLYLFDYKSEHRDACGHGRQFGVMADEVEAIIPEAVLRAPEGHRIVNYALLGITRH